MRLPVPRLRVHGVQGSGFRWTTVLHAYGGQACPQCGAVVIGDNHRAQHRVHHSQLEALEQAVRKLAEGVRELAREAGHGDWYGGEEDQEAAPPGGIVVGNGQLPEEMRGGGE